MRQPFVPVKSGHHRKDKSGKKGTLVHVGRMHTGAATMENSMYVSQKIKIALPYDPANPVLGIYPKDMNFLENILHSCVHCSSIHKHQIMDTIQCLLTDERIKKLWYIDLPLLSESLHSLLCFYEKPILIPVFLNQKKSKDFSFHKKHHYQPYVRSSFIKMRCLMQIFGKQGILFPSCNYGS